MAGFAIFLTFLILGIVGFLGASITSFCLFLYARKRARLTGRKRGVVLCTAAAPFLAFFWLIAAFSFHVWISNHIAHQDCGFGLSADPWVQLPNGYRLGSLNTYSGYIAAPGVRTGQPVVGDGYVRSIIKLKWKDPYFTGTQFDLDTDRTRAFVYDTRTHAITISDPDPDANEITHEKGNHLDAWAAYQAEVHSDPDSYWVMYSQNRHSWPEFVFLILIVQGEAAIGLGILKIWSVSLESFIPRVTGGL